VRKVATLFGKKKAKARIIFNHKIMGKTLSDGILGNK
jgi:hypothetical protein